MLQLITCHGRIMSRLAELLLMNHNGLNNVGRELPKKHFSPILLKLCFLFCEIILKSSNWPTRVLQKVLSLGSDYFSATFYQNIFITNLQSIPPLLKHIFVTFLPSCKKQMNSLLLVSVGDTDK